MGIQLEPVGMPLRNRYGAAKHLNFEYKSKFSKRAQKLRSIVRRWKGAKCQLGGAHLLSRKSSTHADSKRRAVRVLFHLYLASTNHILYI
jgi:hypothetical protein